ncbi:MAG: HD domain-containing protein [Nanoarchaeota archaeon]|nr:HD domain-containing protein [Nanoarchaeota archaeon]MBU1622280.1 HD domain-containing protein [Nanoarchaeota archaeon]
MTDLRDRLIEEARKIIVDDDPSHDLDHALRVLVNAEHIAQFEGGDLEVIVPAALFHDAINYPKDDPRAKYAAEESARVVRGILETFPDYSREKIARVEIVIVEHSYSNGIKPESLDSKIVQDADRLEATGAISIMRTFCSTGQMKRKFYHQKDPFCEQREPSNYAVDLFYKRLLKVRDLMNTETAKSLAEKRTRFLYDFLEQLREEIAVLSPYQKLNT